MTAEKENPYGNLFIYYLEGSLDRGLSLPDSRFIGNWEEDGFSFLFFNESSDEAVDSLMAGHSGLKLLDRFEMTYEQWHGDKVSGFQAGHFFIEPPWAVPEPESSSGLRHHLLLDPGVVFGTGTHPTTRDCLEALQLAFGRDVPRMCLDLGTGTGILALAAGSLGCPRTLAVDLNFLSVKTARRNIRLNELEDRILAVCGSAENFMDYPMDFMIANIHYDIMRKLIDTGGFYQKKRFVLSGLLRSEALAVKERVLQGGARILQAWDQNGIWHTFLGETG